MAKYRPGYDFRSSESLRQRDEERSRRPGGHWQQQEEETGDPCACGIRCSARDYQGNPKRSPRAFCEADRERIGDAITALPQNYARLRLLLPGSGQAEQRVSGSRNAPVPMDLQVEAVMREIVHVTCSWEEQVRAAARLADHPSGRRRDGVALAAASATLAAHLDTLISLPLELKTRFIPVSRLADLGAGTETWQDTAGDAWAYVEKDGTAAGLEFLALDGRIRGMLGLTRQRRRITEVPCDDCDGRTLVQYEAKAGGWEPVVRCTACPNAYIGAHYDLLMARVYQVQLKALADREQQAS